MKLQEKTRVRRGGELTAEQKSDRTTKQEMNREEMVRMWKGEKKGLLKRSQRKENSSCSIPKVFWVMSQVWDLLSDAVSGLFADREEALSGLTG